MKSSPQTLRMGLFYNWSVLLLLLFHAYDTLSLGGKGKEIVGSSLAPVVRGRTEGCFNEFSSLLETTFSMLNNIRCQVFCAENGFTMSATSRATCFCGNTYPSVFHNGPDSLCDMPCNPDKLTCSSYSCCGSADGIHYTVTFAKEIDPILQLLRQLTYDYRHQSPSFQSYVKTLLTESAVLQLTNQQSLSTTYTRMSSSSSSSGTTTTGATSTAGGGYLTLGNGCPNGWTLFSSSCYQLSTAKVRFDAAQTACINMGGHLAVIGTKAENDFVRSMLGTQTSWIALNATLSGVWSWNLYQRWAVDEPATATGIMNSKVFGTATGTYFNDYVRGITGIQKMSLGYRAGWLLGIQLTYILDDGTLYDGPIHGTFTLGGIVTETVTFSSGSIIAGVSVSVLPSGIRGLSFSVRDKAGSLLTYGPYGDLSSNVQKYVPQDVVLGITGAATEGAVVQLGFFEQRVARCSVMNQQGYWEAVSCDDKQDGMNVLCERKPEETKIDCPVGWVSMLYSCYQVNLVNQMSWNDASQLCRSLDASLVSIESEAEQKEAFNLMGGKGFIGFKDGAALKSQNRVWVWDTYSNWDQGQPTTAGACVKMDAKGLWAVIDCDVKIPAALLTICQKKASDDGCTCPSGWVENDCMCYLKRGSDPNNPISWTAAKSTCDSLDSDMVQITSPRENAFVMSLLGNSAGSFLGLQDAFGNRAFSTNYHTSWAPSEPKSSVGTRMCGVMKPDGNWYSLPCVGQSYSYVCETLLAIPVADVKSGVLGESFKFQLTPGTEIQWSEPLPVTIEHEKTGAKMAMDADGKIYSTLENSREAIFLMTLIPQTKGFIIQNKAHNLYVNYENGKLSGLAAEVSIVNPNSNSQGSGYQAEGGPAKRKKRRKTQDGSNFMPKRAAVSTATNLGSSTTSTTTASTSNTTTKSNPVMDSYIPVSIFMSTQLIAPLAIQNLEISVAVYKQDKMKCPRLCSMKVYDLTAASNSYYCYDVYGDSSSQPLVSMSVASWTALDKTRILKPRAALENGRTRCENQSPTETATCSSAYGEGLSFQEQLDVLSGYTIQEYFQVDFVNPISGLPGGYYNFLTAFTNTYTYTSIRAYIESRNWAITVPIEPQSAATIQFWLATTEIFYVWQGILNAVGTFDISTMNVYLGRSRALTVLSQVEDLFFYTFGSYDYPFQAEIIITVNNIDQQKYPFQVPELSNAPAGLGL